MLSALKRPFADPAPADLPPSAAEIAASIRRPSSLQAAEDVLRELRGRREEIRDKVTKLCQDGNGKETSDARKIRAMQAELADVEAEIVEHRRAIVAPRAAHAAKVAAALQPMHDAAARRARDSLRALDEAVATMDAVRVEVERRGGSMPVAGRVEADALREQVGRWAER